MKVIVAGAGVGSEAYYTEAMTKAVGNSDVVLTASRLADGLKKLNSNTEVMGVLDTVEYINSNKEKDITVCVAASGDTGFYSIAATIMKRISPDISVEFITGIGSLQYFASKCRLSYENMKLVSLHGNLGSIIPHVCYNEKVFTLTGGVVKAHDIVNELVEADMDYVQVYIGENLSSENERLISGTPSQLEGIKFDDLSVMIIVNAATVNRYQTLKDADFIRGKSPMTKEAIRSLSVAALEIEPCDVVYDIGAGTGSVTCSMALKACESTVYAVEKEVEAVKLIHQNMDHLGIKNINIVCDTAPGGLEAFPPADKVFIGGSTGNLSQIVTAVRVKNPSAVFVITAVTVETLAEAVKVLDENNYDKEISCVNVSTAHKLGRYNLMKAENPVYIIKGATCNEE